MSIIRVDINKLRSIAHERRRFARSREFAPLDMKSTIPSEANQAEIERQKIRDKYATIQEKIDAAKSVEELAQLMPRV